MMFFNLWVIYLSQKHFLEKERAKIRAREDLYYQARDRIIHDR
jgi:hypothetical protein